MPSGRSVLRYGLVAVVLLVLAVAAYVFRPAGPSDDGVLRTNGRVEGDRITVASKLSGRIVELTVREGDTVSAGQVLARLDERAVRARRDRAQAAIGTLDAQVLAHDAALVLLRAETRVAVDAARARVAAAQAELHRAQAAVEQAERELRRSADLHRQGFVGPQGLERAELAARQARDQRDAAQAARASAHEGLRDAQLGPARVRARAAEAAAARARLAEARAALDEAQSALDDLVIAAPASGTVTTRFTHIGEVVDPGTPLLEIVDLSSLYLKSYVPEPLVGRVRRGMAARIYADAYPGEPFEATVRYIASRAEFTPKEVQTVDERVKLVYEVRLYANGNPDGKLNPGQPADGAILWKEGARWETGSR